MSKELQKLLENNKQKEYPPFMKMMNYSKSVNGSYPFYSKKHCGAINPQNYYKPISLIHR